MAKRHQQTLTPLEQRAHDDIRAYNLALFENPTPKKHKHQWLYPLDEPRLYWLTFADDTGCGLWVDDPASVL